MAVYAGRYDEPLLRLVRGRLAVASGAEVAVYETDGETLATLYTDRTKYDELANPVTVDASGNLEFHAEPGVYILSIREGGTQVATDTVSVPLDPADAGTGAAVETGTSGQMLLEWTAGGDFDLTAVTYDTTYPSVISTATVSWPDGSAGTFTTTDINETWEAIDAFTVTHADTSSTVTQAAVTRNASGLVSSKPALTVEGAGLIEGANAVVAAAFLSGSDKSKLDGIEAGAQVNVGTDLEYDSVLARVTSSTGSFATIPLVGTYRGMMSPADKTKLDGIESGAEVNDITSADIDTISVVTQAEYDALGTPDSRTLYVIEG